MVHHLHHVHLFAADLERALRFYETFFGGRVVLDATLAGARNVFMRVGSGRLHFYDQPPKDTGRGAVHHLGVQTDDLQGLVERLRAAGVPLRKDITDFGAWKYVMVPGPDGVLIEAFEVSEGAIPPELAGYFEGGDQP